MCHRMNPQQYCSPVNIHVLLDGSIVKTTKLEMKSLRKIAAQSFNDGTYDCS